MSVAKQVFNSLTEYIQVEPASGWGRAHPHPAKRPGSAPQQPSSLCPAGPLHREPAEPGAQSSLGRRGGIPACVCPHDDEACSGLRPLGNTYYFGAPCYSGVLEPYLPLGQFQVNFQARFPLAVKCTFLPDWLSERPAPVGLHWAVIGWFF